MYAAANPAKTGLNGAAFRYRRPKFDRLLGGCAWLYGYPVRAEPNGARGGAAENAGMPAKKYEVDEAHEDAAVAWARRKETIRGALKLFRVLLDAARRHAEWVEARHGIGGAHLWVLWELGQSPGMRAVDLAKNMAVHRQTVENLVRELQEKGLVRVEAAAQSPIHFLTSDGQSIADASPEYGQGVLKAALERLPDSALGQVVDSMRALSECLPFREDRAALKPLADILRASAHEPTRQAHAGHRQANLEN